ncbi:MAG: DUF2344 domain-containing protein [Firmicutes bacterium]|nr:DUF2344 domain-containing protein [Bacillota bacterium]
MGPSRRIRYEYEAPVCIWRIRITKTGITKYMSHLDFIRTVERSARRAGLPLTLSGGFNPRPRMSFSPALPVGVSSHSEFVDLFLKESVDIDVASWKLNKSFPSGIRVIASRILSPNVSALSAVIEAASYRLALHAEVKIDPGSIAKAVTEILSEDSIEIVRTTPKGTRRINLRPLIYDIRTEPENLPLSVYSVVASGSSGNVRILDLADIILKFAGIRNNGVFMDITREGLYKFCNESLCLPW